MRELAQAFPDAVVGLSDHTVDNFACIGALALGASIVERHFTDHKGRRGPDIVCSMNRSDLSQLIQAASVLRQERGGSKSMLPEEQVTRDFAYASVVATQDMEAGDALTAATIWVKRPGTGDFHAREYRGLIGRKAARPVSAGTQLARGDVAL